MRANQDSMISPLVMPSSTCFQPKLHPESAWLYSFCKGLLGIEMIFTGSLQLSLLVVWPSEWLALNDVVPKTCVTRFIRQVPSVY